MSTTLSAALAKIPTMQTRVTVQARLMRLRKLEQRMAT